MKNEVLRQLDERKSVRIFTEEPLTAQEKEAILNAAFMAPTPGNQQMYTILDITEPGLKKQLADLCDHQPFIAASSLILVFLADCERWPAIYRAAGLSPRPAGPGDMILAITDACIAAQNCVVAAHSLGLGSCYIGDILENCEAVRETLCLPSGVMPACMLIFGHPTAQQLARKKPVRFAKEHILCENRYTQQTPEQLRRFVEERAEREGTQGFEFCASIKAFCERKYQSAFSREMSRSVSEYLKEFKTPDL